jgi:Bacterial regulatory proteins, luxR family
VAAIRVIAAGEALPAPSVTRRLIEDFATRAGGVPFGHAGLADTARAGRAAIGRKGTVQHGDRRDAGGMLVVAEQTVKTHLGRIFGKLDLRDRAQAVVLAYESGLVTLGR